MRSQYEAIQSRVDKFRAHLFSINKTFELLNVHNNHHLGFLYDLHKLDLNDNLLKHCKVLKIIFTNEDNLDLNTTMKCVTIKAC